MKRRFITCLLGIGLLIFHGNLNAAQPASANILVVGDSLSAAYGMAKHQGWVALIAQRCRAPQCHCRWINASIPGDTTSQGLARLDKLINTHSPQLIIIALGGNDGLRGLPPAQIKRNINAMVQASLQASARVVVLGVRMPPNYGQIYTQAFAGVFAALAERDDITVLPDMLRGVAKNRALMQADNIHPNSKAQPIIAKRIGEVLAPHLNTVCARK